LSVFLFVLFSKRSFVGSAELLLNINERFFYLSQACLSVFLFVLFSKRSFVGSAELLLNIKERFFYLSPSLLERFFVCAIFKAELCRISGATPQH